MLSLPVGRQACRSIAAHLYRGSIKASHQYSTLLPSINLRQAQGDNIINSSAACIEMLSLSKHWRRFMTQFNQGCNYNRQQPFVPLRITALFNCLTSCHTVRSLAAVFMSRNQFTSISSTNNQVLFPAPGLPSGTVP
jgi:hypothetical protein